MITDARVRYVAATNVAASQGLTIQNRCTALDVKLINQRLQVLAGLLLWTNTSQQLANGLTTTTARSKFIEVLRRGAHARAFLW